MLEDLEKLIDYILPRYNEISEKWLDNKAYKRINLKNMLVKEMYANNNNELQSVLDYRAFINKECINLILELQQFNISNKIAIETRVKTQNSIEYKLKNYVSNHMNGESPVIKCLNDTFGIRGIYDADVNYNEISQFIKEKYPKLRCVNSIREGYEATHIYFHYNNFIFPWELQVWEKKKESANKKSHKKYKQAYTKWEIENKGGK